MTPRPDAQGNQRRSTPTRLRPVAAPSGPSFRTPGNSEIALNNFAALSSSLTSAIGALGRARKAQEREEASLEAAKGEAAAANIDLGTLTSATEADLVRRGVIPENASEAWRRGMASISGRRASAKFESAAQEWMQKALSPENLLDENGAPRPSIDPVAALDKLRQEFASKTPMMQNPDFAGGFNDQALPLVEGFAAKYTELRNKTEVAAVESMVITESSDAITEAFRNGGGVVTPEMAEDLVGFARSLSTGKGVPLSKRNNELFFSAIDQFVVEASQADDVDLDEVHAFVQTLVEMKGLNGTASFIDDPNFAEDAAGLLDGINTRSDRLEAKRAREKEQRQEGYELDLQKRFAGASAIEIASSRAAIARGEGEFAGLDDETRAYYLGRLGSLETNAKNLEALEDEVVDDRTDKLLGRLLNNEFSSQAEWQNFVKSVEGVDSNRLVIEGDKHFDELRAEARAEEEDERRAEADRRADKAEREQTITRYTGQVSKPDEAARTLLQGLPLDVRAEAQDALSGMNTRFSLAIRDAVTRGDSEEAIQKIIADYTEELDTFREGFSEDVQANNDKKASVTDSINKGNYQEASATLTELQADGLIDAETYAAEVSRLERQEERFEEQLTAQGNGVMGEMQALVNLVADELEGDLLQQLLPNNGYGLDQDPKNFFVRMFTRSLERDARKFAEEGRHTYESQTEFEAGLREHLEEKMEAWFTEAGGEVQKASVGIFRAIRDDGGLLEFQREMEREMRLENMSAAAGDPAGNELSDVRTASGRIGNALLEADYSPTRSFRADFGRTGTDVPFDPLAAEGEQERLVMEPVDRVRTQEYLFITDRVDQGLAALDFRTAGKGLSVDEVLSGEITIGLTDRQRKQLEINRNRITGYQGARGNIPTEDYFLKEGDDYRLNFGHVFTFGAFMTEENFAKVKSRAQAHYDRMIALPDAQVQLDAADIGRRASALDGDGQGLLVFGSQEELNEFTASPETHPYFSLFQLNPTTAESFGQIQATLLESKSAAGLLETPYVEPEPEPEPQAPEPMPAEELARQAAAVDETLAPAAAERQAELEEEERVRKFREPILRRWREAVAQNEQGEAAMEEAEQAAISEATGEPQSVTQNRSSARPYSYGVPEARPDSYGIPQGTEERLRFFANMASFPERADNAKRRERLRELLPDMRERLDNLRGRVTPEDFGKMQAELQIVEEIVGGDDQ